MRKYLPALLLLILVISIPSEALAQRGSTNKVEFTPFVGYRFSNTLTAEIPLGPGVSTFEDIKLTSGISYGFVIGFPISDYITIEGQYSRRSSDLEVEGLMPKHVVGTGTASYIHGGAAFTINPYSRGAKWFVSLNAGVATFGADIPEMEVDSQSKFSFGFSVGAKIPLSDSIKLRTEFRGYSTRTDLTTLGWICGYYTCGVVESNQYLWEGEARLGIEFGF